MIYDKQNSVHFLRKYLRSIFCVISFHIVTLVPLGSCLFIKIVGRPTKSTHRYVSLSPEVDTRPYEQRTNGPRAARRLNHGFRYLYRENNTQFRETSSLEYLSQYYPKETIYQMNNTFPPLLDLNVSRHLHPKMRFLQETMGVTNVSQIYVPPHYFGARLERIIAPRHAFLVYKGLPHGHDLINNPKMWQDFLASCRATKRFCALCNQWRPKSCPPVTAKQIEAFDVLFGRGALAAARDELVQSNNTWPLDYINVTSAEILKLLIQHGANPLERDNRGTTLIHWAAGTGNLEAVKGLLPYFSIVEKTERDGATPLHWAAAGANSKEFGTGGHTEVCRYLLDACNEISTKELVNQLTYDGNSPLMWAGWSGTLETVKLMIRNRADHTIANRNGCTVAHWAASGGNVHVCEYLGNVVKADFSTPNHGGNTPLTHAVAFGRPEVVKWIREKLSSEKDDEIAAQLAEDFFLWTEGDAKRRQVLQLFRDDYWDEGVDEADMSINTESQRELEMF